MDKSMVAGILNELLDTLYEQKKALENLTDRTLKQTEAMRENNLKGIEKAATEQAFWAERLGSVEEKYLALRGQLEKHLDLPQKTSFSGILERIPEEALDYPGTGPGGNIKEEIADTAAKLMVMMQELQVCTDTNKLLADRALGLYSRVLSQISQAQGESYNKDGKLSGGGQSLLNKKG